LHGARTANGELQVLARIIGTPLASLRLGPAEHSLMSAAKPPRLVSTVWFEPSGAKRHTPCKANYVGDRVRLIELQGESVQADVSAAVFQKLVKKGLVRPLDEVPTLRSGRLPRKHRVG
jgi:hypothetical protein